MAPFRNMHDAAADRVLLVWEGEEGVFVFGVDFGVGVGVVAGGAECPGEGVAVEGFRYLGSVERREGTGERGEERGRYRGLRLWRGFRPSRRLQRRGGSIRIQTCWVGRWVGGLVDG